MARLSSEIEFTGPIGNVTAYKMRGVDRVILRMKGGPSKSKIKRSPKFQRTREINAEFSGRATASKWIMHALRPQKPLADYNIAGPLNALIKPIQELDLASLHGKRSIELSKNPRLLEGFSLNRNLTFDSVLRTTLSFSISRADLAAGIDIPELVPGINFFAPKKYPLYSIVMALGIVPDLFYTEDKMYRPLNGYDMFFIDPIESEWFPVTEGSPAITLNSKLDSIPPDNAYSLILSVGIRFGTVGNASKVMQVKHAGAAKVLAMA